MHQPKPSGPPALAGPSTSPLAAGVAGDGSQHAPFHSLSEAETSSQPGDTIYVLGNATGKTLDGGIALKPRQKLIGLGVDGEPPQRPSDRPRLTNSASLPGGIIVRVSEHNEVAGIHFTGMRNAAIAGDGATYSGTFIHHTTFTGHADEHIEVENTDVVGTTYGFTLNGPSGGGGHAVTVDLGGGVLGSRGHNRFIDNAKGAMRLAPHRVAAQHNWWGGAAPTVYDSSDRQIDDADVLLDPALASDPR